MICHIANLHPDGTPPPHWDDEGIIGTAVVMGYIQDARVLKTREAAWWSGPYAWNLVDVVVLPEAIPCKGHQGLWDLPADIEAALTAEGKP